MATIFAATSLELDDEKKKEFLDEMGKSIGTVFKNYSLYYTPVPQENVSSAPSTRSPGSCSFRPTWRSTAVAS